MLQNEVPLSEAARRGQFARVLAGAHEAGMLADRRGWLPKIMEQLAAAGALYFPNNPCEVVPAGDGTVAQTPLKLSEIRADKLIDNCRLAVNNTAIKRFFGGVCAATGTDLAVVAASQAFGWRIRLSSDTLTWNFAAIKVKLTYNSTDRVIYTMPMAGQKYVDFIALAFSDNAGFGSIIGPTTATFTVNNSPLVNADSPGTIPSKTAITIETLSVRDLGAA